MLKQMFGLQTDANVAQQSESEDFPAINLNNVGISVLLVVSDAHQDADIRDETNKRAF